MAEYRLTNIDDDFWRRVKTRAAYDGHTLRFVILRLLRMYLKHGLAAIEAALDGRNKE